MPNHLGEPVSRYRYPIGVDTSIGAGVDVTDVESTDDPTVIRSIAVHAGDVVSAYEAVTRGTASLVLRIHPPYHARMRARLHRQRPRESEREVDPIDLNPRALIDQATLPIYPEPTETEREIRNDPAVEYSTDTHHERHVAAVHRWRDAARSSIVDSVGLPGGDGVHRVSVKVFDGGEPRNR